MYRARRLSGAALAITMFGVLVLTLSGSAGAQEDQTVEVSLTQSRDSGVSGTATLKDVKGGVEVTLQMRVRDDHRHVHDHGHGHHDDHRFS